MLFFHICFCTHYLIYSTEESRDLATAAQESKAEPVRTTVSLVKSARKTLPANIPDKQRAVSERCVLGSETKTNYSFQVIYRLALC